MSESRYDKKLREVGNSIVVTVPKDTVEKLGLKPGEIVEITIRKVSKK